MLAVRISPQSKDLLEQLAALGIYGASPDEVAARFVDQALQRIVEARLIPAIALPSTAPKRKGRRR
jgi:hypothetical protein